ncbi:MAG: hypothetical protein A2V88_10705 [Elusimicrobia bacterium RBG_16_66_12]|nr:MAG: hypothetical protein A2V88_10705 [Elusimicrobia bacterium RBG_16_66_12]
MSARIAVVDDDAGMLELLSLVLDKAGYKVRAYPTPGRFFDGVLKTKPDLCLIDVQLPGMDGREVIRVLRANAETRKTVLIAMSAHATRSSDAAMGLEIGADEYMTKPLDMDFLLVRISGLLARSREGAPSGPEVVRWGALSVVPDEHRVTLGGQDVPFTRLEFQLLLAFLSQPNRVLARSWLLQTVWQASPGIATRTVDKHVESLRKKLPPFGKKVETVVGVGYLFRP